MSLIKYYTTNDQHVCKKCYSVYSKKEFSTGSKILPFGWPNQNHPDPIHECLLNMSDFEMLAIAVIIPCIYIYRVATSNKARSGPKSKGFVLAVENQKNKLPHFLANVLIFRLF